MVYEMHPSRIDVRFGSKADIRAAKSHVRLPPKAHIGVAQINVCKGHKRTYVATTPGPSLKPQNLSSCVAHITLKRADRD